MGQSCKGWNPGPCTSQDVSHYWTIIQLALKVNFITHFLWHKYFSFCLLISSWQWIYSNYVVVSSFISLQSPSCNQATPMLLCPGKQCLPSCSPWSRQAFIKQGQAEWSQFRILSVARDFIESLYQPCAVGYPWESRLAELVDCSPFLINMLSKNQTFNSWSQSMFKKGWRFVAMFCVKLMWYMHARED